MKNLLVDALRQAGGSEDSRPSPARESERPATPDADLDAELKLLEGDALAAAATSPATAETVEETVEETAAEVAEAVAEKTADDEVEEAAGHTELALMPENTGGEPEPASSALPVDELTRAGATAVGKPRRAAAVDWVARLGRLSPLLYLLGVTAGAASFAGYQRLHADAMNVEIGSMPPRQSASDTPSTPASAWRPLPATEARTAPAGIAAGADLGPPPRVAESPAAAPRSDAAVRVAADSPAEAADPALPVVRAAYQAYAQADYVEAEARYREALAIDRHHRHALLGLAAVLEQGGRAGEAIELYERLVRTDPDDVEAVSRLASVETGERLGVETRLKLLAQRFPVAASVRAALGNFYAAEGRWPEAHESFSRALALSPDRAVAHYNVAASAERLGHFDAARTHYAQALAATPPVSSAERQQIEARLSALAAHAEPLQ